MTNLEKYSIKRLRALKDIDLGQGRHVKGRWIERLDGQPPTGGVTLGGIDCGQGHPRVVHARSIHHKPSGWAGEVYQDVRHEGEEFEIADEPPGFRARELVLHGLAESVDHVKVSIEPMPDGFAKYHAWYAPGQNLYGKAATGPFELVEWTGLSWHPGWPKEPCRLRLVVGNFDPLCYCYEGESIEGKLFRIELQRDPVLETSASLQRERNKWIDRQILLDKQKEVAKQLVV